MERLEGKLLEDLFRLARRILPGASVGYDQDVQAKQSEALRLLQLYALSDTAGEALAPTSPTSCGTSLEMLADAHPALPREHRPAGREGAALADRRGLQVMIYAKDEPDLFARICSCRVDQPRSSTRRSTDASRYALDTFLVLGTRTSRHYRDMIGLIEHELGERLEHAPRGESAGAGACRAGSSTSDHPRCIRPDERAVLPRLDHRGRSPRLPVQDARVFSEYVDLHAKIVTLGERAEDVFVVSGKMLAKPRTVLQLEQDLLIALQ